MCAYVVDYERMFEKSSAKTYKSLLKDIDLAIAFKEPKLIARLLQEKMVPLKTIVGTFKALRAVAKAIIKENPIAEVSIDKFILKGSYSKNLIADNKMQKLETVSEEDEDSESDVGVGAGTGTDIHTGAAEDAGTDIHTGAAEDAGTDISIVESDCNELTFLKNLVRFMIPHLTDTIKTEVLMLLFDRIYDRN